ncbi:T9SS type A sorting domain-containing protein [Cytophagaceae bacterium YF14B1]|uniref:T9SS type A sorting domain-containing protein n=1 Tax=Xanthocytophaga flava TaxID=3048013 RepID=A0AAE3UD45_9BACT|nr:T9SS type A sorting domain-containing protein [Xanthocytophaga flavus]MDJ1486168.1 T9SS type A sorting domain-containing protein [Xanthocytophaga flavus]
MFDLFTNSGRRFILFVLFLIAGAFAMLTASAQTTYSWNAASLNPDWNEPANWTPARNSPASSDIIQFNATPVSPIINVSADSIGRIVVRSGVKVSLTASTNANGKTLVVTAGSGNSIDLNSNSSLTFLGTSRLNLSLAADLSIGNGAILVFNAQATQTLSVTGNLLASNGTIDISSGNLDHILNLAGTSNSVGVFTTSTTSNSTVVYSGNTNQTIFASSNYINVSTLGSNTKTLQGDTQIKADLSIGKNTTMDVAAYNLTIGGNTVIAGNFKDVQNQGVNTFTGTVNIASTGSFSITGTSSLIFKGGITNNGTFSTTGSQLTFSEKNQTLSGSKSLSIGGNVLISGPITLTNQITEATSGISITGVLNGNDAGSVFENKTLLIYRNNSIPMVIGSLLASSCPNKVQYQGSSQSIKATTYCNLFLTGATKFLTGTTSVSNELTVFNSTSLQIGGNDLTVYGRTWIPILGKLLDNSSAGVTNLANVEISRNSSIDNGGGSESGVVNINGKLITSGEVVTIGGVTLTVSGETIIQNGGVRISNALGAKKFNTITLSNPTAATTGWSNDANAPIIISGNLTVNAGMTFNAGTGMYTFAGSNNTIFSNIVLFIPSATFNGIYTVSNGSAVGADILIANPLITPGGKVINATTSYPLTVAKSYTARAFNNESRAFFNKFDHLSASGDAGNTVSATNTINFTFTRSGSGEVYALRSRDLSPVPTTAIVRFNLQGTTSSANGRAQLLLGSNMEDNTSSVNAIAGLVFNLKNNNSLSISSLNGSYTSGDYTSPDKEFWWVVNRSGADQTYTGPNGNSYPISSNTSDLWYNGAIVTTGIAIAAGTNPVGEIKFALTAGIASIKLNDLRINPIAKLSISPICWYGGQPVAIPVTLNTVGPGGGFNAGTVFKVQRSNANGVFNQDLSQDIYGTLTPADPASSTVFTISTTFPDRYSDVGIKDLGNNYRYRVISTDLLVVSANNDYPMYYIANPGPESIDPNFPTLSAVTAYESGKYLTSYWGYTYGSTDTKIIKIPSASGNSYTPKLSDFPGTGEYYLVAVSTSGCMSNAKKIVVNCSGTGNLIKNGDFSKLGKYGVGKGINDINGNGILEFDQGDFESEFNQHDPNAHSYGWPIGDYTISTNPNWYYVGFCDMSNGNRAPTKDSNGKSIDGGNMLIADAPTSGSAIAWRQTITNLKPYTNYVFTFWAASLDRYSQNTLQFAVYVDCYRMGDDIVDNYASSCNWSKYSVQLNTGNQTQLTLGIGNISASGLGNDVAFDNIELYECSSKTSNGNNFAVVNKFVWKGYTSDWFNSDNWGVCAPNLPTCGDDVVIPATLPGGRVYPVISKNYQTRSPSSINNYGGTNINNSFTGSLPNTAAQVRNLTIETGATLTVNDSYMLRICGNVNNNGSVITNTTGTIVFFGNDRQNISGSGVFNNLAIDQGKSTDQAKSATTVVSQTSSITVNGLLDMKKSSDKLDINGNTLYLNGTISTNSGTIKGSNTSSIVVGGSGTTGGPILFSPGAQQLKSLVIDRAGGQITLGTPLQLVGGLNALTLTNGIITTDNTNLLTLDQTSTVSGASEHVSGGSNASHINGPMAKITAGTTAFTFPVGNSGALGEIGIQPSSSNYNTFKAQYFRQNPYELGKLVQPPLGYISALEYWRMERVSGTSKGKISLHWSSYSAVSPLAAGWKDLRVTRYSALPDTTQEGISPAEGIWQSRGNSAIGGGSTKENGYITSTEIGSFSPYTFGTMSVYNPLPVQMLTFTGSIEKQTVHLNWSTINEKNSAYFNVMRSSDGIHFTAIGKVPAQGESSSAYSYAFVDENPMAINYYRLDQVDTDYQTTLSKVISIHLTLSEIKVDIFPNPSDGKQLYLYTNYQGKVQISITNLLGVKLGEQTVMADGNTLDISPSIILPAGLYVITVQTGTKASLHKIVIE